jgi:hypothetical protein
VNYLPGLGWPGTSILRISAFQVARITGVRHQHPVKKPDFQKGLLLGLCLTYGQLKKNKHLKSVNYPSQEHLLIYQS